MAKRDGGGVSNARASELKDKLRGLLKMIVDDDDYTVQTTDDAISTLSALKDFKYRRSFSDKLNDFAVPSEFRCPISTELMRDPVILATGQVYIIKIIFLIVYIIIFYFNLFLILL